MLSFTEDKKKELAEEADYKRKVEVASAKATEQLLVMGVDCEEMAQAMDNIDKEIAADGSSAEHKKQLTMINVRRQCSPSEGVSSPPEQTRALAWPAVCAGAHVLAHAHSCGLCVCLCVQEMLERHLLTIDGLDRELTEDATALRKSTVKRINAMCDHSEALKSKVFIIYSGY